MAMLRCSSVRLLLDRPCKALCVLLWQIAGLCSWCVCHLCAADLCAFWHGAPYPRRQLPQ